MITACVDLTSHYIKTCGETNVSSDRKTQDEEIKSQIKEETN